MGIFSMLAKNANDDVVNETEVLSDQAYVWSKKYGLYGLPDEEAV